MGLYTVTVCWSHSYSFLFLAVFHRGLPEGHTLLQDSRDSWTSNQAFGSFQMRAMLADCLRHVSSTQSHASLERRSIPKPQIIRGLNRELCMINVRSVILNRDTIGILGQHLVTYQLSTAQLSRLVSEFSVAAYMGPGSMPSHAHT